MINIPEIFGSDVFNEVVMKERLPKETFSALKKTLDEGKSLDPALAAIIANSMKDWAIEKGATHFTHWFQPMTGITAEKHDSFISPTPDGKVIMEFSGKELIKGESDASSFPSGGLRSTFEARGYTAWDPTSFAFIKDGTLCIPTAFCSYTGEALDKKTPLLRSIDAISKASRRILKLFGTDVKRVNPTVGPEQEYFLIDRDLYTQRKDLVYTGRTLFGAKAPKGQELEDHYYGMLRMRVSAFMKDLDESLWKLGISAKTKHNEAAPAQHELAPIFSTTNIATDHNQLTMEIMRKVAHKHGLKCLLHEKPFAGINGSGKHNNWSLSTNTGTNLLDPGKTPIENAQFLTFLVAVIKAVNDYQEMLRITVASAGNDHRLGASEAPPAIISIFLGDELTEILEAISHGEEYKGTKVGNMEIGVHVLPKFPRDTTDRNRTSPFAFTGNKFEFRSPGSAISVAGPNTVINTIVADTLNQFADKLECAENFQEALDDLIRTTIRENERIIFNGNGYSEEWVEEAKKRGLANLHNTPAALSQMLLQKNIDVFERNGVYTEAELRSRYEINLENYSKTINIEALTMIEMVRKDILPAVSTYIRKLSEAAASTKTICPEIACTYEIDMVKKLSYLADTMYQRLGELDRVTAEAATITDGQQNADYFGDTVLNAMQSLREVADEIETLVGEKYWPYPTYGKLLFNV